VARTCLNPCLVSSLLPSNSRSDDPPPNNLLPWGYPLSSLTDKTSTDGAHRGAYRRDHRASLKDLFIKINPHNVVDCHSVHTNNGWICRVRDWIFERMTTSILTTRLDSSLCCIDNLSHSARLQLAPQHRRAAASLDDQSSRLETSWNQL
jgi:hypothetical protein